MKQYLKFVWDSTIHPNSMLDLLAPIQLVLVIICFSFMGIYIYQSLKEKYGKK